MLTSLESSDIVHQVYFSQKCFCKKKRETEKVLSIMQQLHSLSHFTQSGPASFTRIVFGGH